MMHGVAQLELPLSRDAKLASLRELRSQKSALVSATLIAGLADLLTQIELTPGDLDLDGFKRIDRSLLAARLDVAERTVTRHRKAAEELWLLQVQERRSADRMRVELWWKIDWGNVRRRGQMQITADAQADDEQRQDPEQRHVASGDLTDASLTEPPAGHLSRAAGQMSRAAGHFFEPARPNPKKDINKKPNQPKDTQTPIGGAGGNVPVGRDKNSVATPAARPRIRPHRMSTHFVITEKTLTDPEELQEWFEWACERGKTHEIYRHHVFATARSVWRRRAKLANPYGAFFSIVRKRLWSEVDPATKRPRMIYSNEDSDWAEEQFRELARREYET